MARPAGQAPASHFTHPWSRVPLLNGGTRCIAGGAHHVCSIRSSVSPHSLSPLLLHNDGGKRAPRDLERCGFRHAPSRASHAPPPPLQALRRPVMGLTTDDLAWPSANINSSQFKWRAQQGTPASHLVTPWSRVPLLNGGHGSLHSERSPSGPSGSLKNKSLSRMPIVTNACRATLSDVAFATLRVARVARCRRRRSAGSRAGHSGGY